MHKDDELPQLDRIKVHLQVRAILVLMTALDDVNHSSYVTLFNMAQKEKKATLQRVSATARRALVWDMRVRGMSLRAIALQLLETHKVKVAPMTVQNDVQFVLERLQGETRQLATEHRTVMLERIEQGIKAIFGEVIKGDIPAIHALVRLMERESKLVGADAPAKIDIEHRVRAMARERGFDEDEAVRAAEVTYQEERKLLTAG